ncbi:MAG: hypothetical protein LBV16_09310 [Elusimicrobiota bacterium]|jgi:hypothetical protein|nr:hypothetical protein [Elusimicrobiota bacterium]
MIDFLIDVSKISIAVFAVNKLMFWVYRKREKEYYGENVVDKTAKK